MRITSLDFNLLSSEPDDNRASSNRRSSSRRSSRFRNNFVELSAMHYLVGGILCLVHAITYFAEVDIYVVGDEFESKYLVPHHSSSSTTPIVPPYSPNSTANSTVSTISKISPTSTNSPSSLTLTSTSPPSLPDTTFFSTFFSISSNASFFTSKLPSNSILAPSSSFLPNLENSGTFGTSGTSATSGTSGTYSASATSNPVADVMAFFVAGTDAFAASDETTSDSMDASYDQEQEERYYFGLMLALGFVTYLLGKLFMSFMFACFPNSRFNGHSGLVISVVMQAGFAFLMGVTDVPRGSGPVPTARIVMAYVQFCLLRFFAGWEFVCVVKIVSNWFPRRVHGRVMSLESLGGSFGDGIVRLTLGLLIEEHGFDWRGVFIFSSVMTGLAAVPLVTLVRDSPASIGLPLPNDFGPEFYALEAGQKESGLLRSTKFVCVLLLSFELAMIRSFFLTYGALFLVQELGVTESDASYISSIFPFMGLLSVPLAGAVFDRYGGEKDKQTMIFPSFSFIAFVALMLLNLEYDNLDQSGVAGLYALIGFSVLGPFSLLSGAISLQFGGIEHGATVSGVVGATGYFGVFVIVLLSSFYGFETLFKVASFSAFSAVVTSIMLYIILRKQKEAK